MPAIPGASPPWTLAGDQARFGLLVEPHVRELHVHCYRMLGSFHDAEVAELLGTSVPAVNSTLQRARAGLGRGVPPAGISPRSLPLQEQEVLRRFMLAWQRRDIGGLAALLREDAVLHMPPQSLRYLGREAIARFFAAVPADGRLDRIRLVATGANGHPALAAYLPAADGSCRAYGVMVLVVSRTGSRPSPVSRTPRWSAQSACPRPWLTPPARPDRRDHRAPLSAAR